MSENLLPPKGRSWAAVFTATAILIVVGGSISNTYGLFAVEWVKTMGVSRGQVLLGGVLATQLSGLYGIMIGRLLAAGVPERAFLAGGALCGAITFVLLSWSGSLFTFYLAYILAGALALAMTSSMVGQTLAVRSFATPGLPVSIVSLGMKGGAAIMPIAAVLLMHRFAVDGALSVMALMMAACVPLAWFLVPPAAGSAQAATERGATPDPIAESLSAGRILTDPVFIGIVIVAASVMAISSAFYFNLPFLVVEMDGDPAWAAYMLSIATICSAVMTPFVGIATDRIDLRLLLIVPVLLVGAVVVIISTSPPFAFVALAAFAMTSANAFFLPCFPGVLRHRFGNRQFSKALGLSQPFFYSSSLGAFAAGALRDGLGSYAATFQALGALVVLAVIGLLLINRSWKRGHYDAGEESP